MGEARRYLRNRSRDYNGVRKYPDQYLTPSKASRREAGVVVWSLLDDRKVPGRITAERHQEKGSCASFQSLRSPKGDPIKQSPVRVRTPTLDPESVTQILDH
jgi:hypothetical protein